MNTLNRQNPLLWLGLLLLAWLVLGVQLAAPKVTSGPFYAATEHHLGVTRWEAAPRLGLDAWTTKSASGDTVGAKGGLPPLRQAYVNEVKALEDIALNMRAAGASPEQVARQLHQIRRDLGVQYKELTPAPQLEAIYARNLEKYGDKLGPTVDWLRAQGKSWEQIIESASRAGGKDLGF